MSLDRIILDRDVIPAAEAQYRAGAFGAAAALLTPLSEVDPSPDALRLLGLCRLRLGAPAEALDLLARALAQAPADPFARLHYGIGLHAVGRLREAASLFEGCQALLPDDPAPSLNLSAALLGLGDRRGAIRAARRARLRAPDLAHTHYTLGLAYLADGGYGQAETCFRAATRLAPGFADGWVNLGIAAYQDGRLESAKVAMRKALAADPDHQVAAANLGAFLRLTGETEASEMLLRDVIARRPDAPGARINLAADLLAEDRAVEALDLLGGDPPAVHETGEAGLRQAWLLQLSLALIRLDRTAEARDTLTTLGTVPPALAPLLQWRQLLLAMADGDNAAARGHAEAMERALAQAVGVTPEHRIMGHYDLAKFWSQQLEADRAFACWTAGHRLLARFQPFSRAAHGAFVDATITAFTADRLARGPRAANRDAAPVFVVGMPRSGTTLVEQILAAHGDVHGAGERAALGTACHDLSGGADQAAAVHRIAGLDAASLDAAADTYLQALHSLAPDARRIVDKMPGNFAHLGLVALMLPGARVISCERDPRDIGLSIFTYRFYGAHGYAHDLADLGWYISQQRRLMAYWRNVLPNPILTVQLTDWIEDFSATLQRVLAFLDLPDDPACARFHEMRRRVRTVSRAQVQEPVNDRGVGRWRPYERHLAPLIAELKV